MKQRLHGVLRGAVQGVGFRPFVYRLARELRLQGWVMNSSQGVFLEAEGPKEHLDEFILRIESDLPPRASIHSAEYSFLDPAGFTTFEIRPSEEKGPRTTLVLPDIATCDLCLHEIHDSTNRRYRYPFTNCTNCGPRFSILERLPYDRPNTTMRGFTMCPACQHEYDSPDDRRFHAQPNACPVCGPHLEVWDPDGRCRSTHDEALRESVAALLEGHIVAVKGIGGFHLMVAAGNEEAVRTLRNRKRREEKPFAVMFPSVDDVQHVCACGPFDERLLRSPESPIVLMQRNDSVGTGIVARAVAPNNPWLGVMVPYSPLHHLLLRDAGIPVVATSGNCSDEPMCRDEHEAVQRLHGIADLFLVHNRPITRHVDDSIVRVVLGRELVLRRARGYAPLPVSILRSGPDLLGVGAHLKNSVALSRGSNVFVSQHLGDLDTPLAFDAFQRETARLEELFEGKPAAVVSDLHPDYLSSTYARSRPQPVVTVQHHQAHVAACMADNGLDPPVLGVSWDGTGLGTDGTVWGGEWFSVSGGAFHRRATFRQFLLPGGDRAIQEPRRTAIGILYAIQGEDVFRNDSLPPVAAWNDQERRTLKQMLTRRINSPSTSSAGRLFDAVSAIVGLRQLNAFEGQAAMELEFIANRQASGMYAFRFTAPETPDAPLIVDWEQMIEEILEERLRGVPPSTISMKFHVTLAAMIGDVAERIGLERVLLTGGCFQNVLLTELAVGQLRTRGFRPYWHQRIPPNDGGIAVGQIVAVRLLDMKGKGKNRA